jgi:hypothetical protein
VQNVARTFMKPPSGKLNLKAVMREILSLAAHTTTSSSPSATAMPGSGRCSPSRRPRSTWA